MIKGKARIRDDIKTLQVSYEDYEAETFGGDDYEAIYTLDEENREKLILALLDEGLRGSFEDMILERFGVCLDKGSFAGYCDERQIKYDLFTWIS